MFLFLVLKPDLHKAIQLKAIETSTSVPELINNAVRESIAEDSEDFAVFERRVGEPLISYNEMVNKLRKDGRV